MVSGGILREGGRGGANIEDLVVSLSSGGWGAFSMNSGVASLDITGGKNPKEESMNVWKIKFLFSSLIGHGSTLKGNCR